MSVTALEHLWSVRNGHGVPRERPKRFGVASGTSKMALGLLGSVKNSIGVPRARLKQSEGDSSASVTALEHLWSI